MAHVLQSNLLLRLAAVGMLANTMEYAELADAARKQIASDYPLKLDDVRAVWWLMWRETKQSRPRGEGLFWT